MDSAKMQSELIIVDSHLQVDRLMDTKHWVKDTARPRCNICTQSFTTMRRRHHCRTCGEVVCYGCSQKREIRKMNTEMDCCVRVCMHCMMRATDNAVKQKEMAVRELSTILSTCSGESTGESSLDEEEVSRHSIIEQSKILDTPEEPMYDMLVSIIQHTFHTPIAAIAMIGDADNDLWIKASAGCSRDDFPSHMELCTRTIKSESLYIIRDTDGLPEFDGKDVNYFAGCPIRVQGNNVGLVFTLDFCDRTLDLTEKQRLTLESVAKIAAKNIDLRMLDSTCELPSVAEIVKSVDAEVKAAEKTQDEESESEHEDPTSPLPSTFVKSTKSLIKRQDSASPYTMPTLPQDYRDQIMRNISLIDRLSANGEWKWATIVNDITLSVCSIETNPKFVKASCSIAHHPRAVWSQLVDLCNSQLYEPFIKSCSTIQVVNAQATLYKLQLQGGHEQAVLLHWRVNKDGSISIVAMKVSQIDAKLSAFEDFLFGWRVEMSKTSDKNVHVTMFSTCPSASPHQELPVELHNMCEGVQRLSQLLQKEMIAPYLIQGKLTNPHIDLPPTRALPEEHLVMRKLIRAPAKSAKANDTKVLFELLNRALETQENIAMQQETMLSTIGIHGMQISDIAEMITRLEGALLRHGLLGENGQPTSISAECKSSLESRKDSLESTYWSIQQDEEAETRQQHSNKRRQKLADLLLPIGESGQKVHKNFRSDGAHGRSLWRVHM